MQGLPGSSFNYSTKMLPAGVVQEENQMLSLLSTLDKVIELEERGQRDQAVKIYENCQTRAKEFEKQMGYPAVEFINCALMDKALEFISANKFEAAAPIGQLLDLDFFENHLEKMADYGFKAALHVLGRRYCTGVGVERDIFRGIEYLKKSADLGYLPAIELYFTITRCDNDPDFSEISF